MARTLNHTKLLKVRPLLLLLALLVGGAIVLGVDATPNAVAPGDVDLANMTAWRNAGVSLVDKGQLEALLSPVGEGGK